MLTIILALLEKYNHADIFYSMMDICVDELTQGVEESLS